MQKFLALPINKLARTANFLLSFVGAKIIRQNDLDNLISTARILRNTLCTERHSTDFKKLKIYDFVSSRIELSQSQLLQDLIAAAISGPNGYYVEFGAADGKELSNTFFLENNFGWTGILCEPAKIWKKKLKKNRPNSSIDFRAVSGESGKKLVFNQAKSPLLSKLNEFSTDTSFLGRNYIVESVSLTDLLTEHHAPETIDLISMDIEGLEYEVLKTFNWEKYNVQIWFIEHNYSQNEELIRSMMVSKGYTQILKSVSEQDSWWIQNSLSEVI